MPDLFEIVLYALGASAVVSIFVGAVAIVAGVIRDRQRRK
jgi:hypothetical protein